MGALSMMRSRAPMSRLRRACRTTHGMRNEVKAEVVKRKEMCLPKRKEKAKYFLKRRYHEQYRMFCGEYPDLTAIGSINPIVVGRGSGGRSLSQSPGSVREDSAGGAVFAPPFRHLRCD